MNPMPTKFEKWKQELTLEEFADSFTNVNLDEGDCRMCPLSMKECLANKKNNLCTENKKMG